MIITKEREAYRLLKAQPNGLPAGAILYCLRYSDYGCANLDSRVTGIEHRSMTLKPDGGYPGTSVPRNYLQRVPYKPHLRQWKGVWCCSDTEGNRGPHVTDENPSKALELWHHRVSMMTLGLKTEMPA